MAITLLQDLRIQTVMRTAPWVVHELDLLEGILKLVAQKAPPVIPVVDDAGCFQGVISPTDLERGRQLVDLKEYLIILAQTLTASSQSELMTVCQLEQPLRLTAKELMSVDYPVGQAEDPLFTVIQKLSDSPEAQACVILDAQQQVVGLLTAQDIFQLLRITPVQTNSFLE